MLGFGLLILSVIFLLRILAPKPLDLGDSTREYKRCDQNPDDRRHKWILRFETRDRRGYLVCKMCGKIPGEDE